MRNSFVIVINYSNAKCNDVYHSNDYGIKCLRNLLRLEPCNIMFKVISDKMAHWYDL